MISVIVPVYNAGNQLESCIGMILAQNVLDIELLLIDDGSTDGSDAVCDAFAAKDPRVRVLHKMNGGASSARNAGLDQARGDFVAFVDADDRIPENHLRTLLDVQQKTQADLVNASMTYVPGPVVSHSPLVCDSEQFIELVLYRDGVGDYPVSKLYRRSMFDGLRFQEGVTSEDFEIFYRLYRRAGTIAITDKTTYYYIQNNTSVSNSGFSEKFFNRIEICERLIQEVEQDMPCLLPAARSRAVDEAVWLYGILPVGRYPEQRAWIKSTLAAWGRPVLRDPKATQKVKRKVRIFLLCPALWILRMHAKAFVIACSTALTRLKACLAASERKEQKVYESTEDHNHHRGLQ